MQLRKIILTVLTVAFAATFAFGQNEAVKVVVNNLGLFKQKKDLKYLDLAKKAVDSVVSAASDPHDLERNVYKAVVYSVILYADTLNKLHQPPALFNQTVDLVDKLSGTRKIYRFDDQMIYAKQCLANVYIRKAFTYIGKSDYINALKLFQYAQNYAPSNKRLMAYIAYSNAKLGHVNTAAKCYTELIGNGDAKAEYVESAADIYKSLGDTAMALDIILKGRKLLPADKSLLLDEANIYTNKRDYQSLYPLLSGLLDTDANNADIAFVAADCYDHLNKLDKAETLYLKATDLNSSAYEPIFNLGLLYLKQSETNNASSNHEKVLQAKQWLEKAVEISPNDVNCLLALRMVYRKTGSQEQLNNINNKIKQITNQ